MNRFPFREIVPSMGAAQKCKSHRRLIVRQNIGCGVLYLSRLAEITGAMFLVSVLIGQDRGISSKVIQERGKASCGYGIYLSVVAPISKASHCEQSRQSR
jgi:hypothetical protein